MTNDKTREDFEAWARPIGWPHAWQYLNTNEFGFDSASWDVWQAATQHSVARIAELENVCGSGAGCLYKDARIEALRRDAQRYRWLRNEVRGWYIGPEYSTYNDIVCEGEYHDLSAGGIALDSAIDAAMLAAAPQPKEKSDAS